MSLRRELQPLAGKSLVITRARQQASKVRGELEALGAQVIELAMIEMVPPASYEPLDAALQALQHYQWLVVTSSNTVRVLRERCALLGIAPGAFAGLHCAAVGSATAEALREFGVSVDVVPQTFVGEGLLEALREWVSGCRVLLARAEVARDVLPDGLRDAGAVVDVVDAYRNVIPEASAAQARVIFTAAVLPHAILFTSSSTVRNFFQLTADLPLAPEVRVISIGPVTSATLREYGREPDVEAERHDIAGLVDATVRLLSL